MQGSGSRGHLLSEINVTPAGGCHAGVVDHFYGHGPHDDAGN